MDGWHRFSALKKVSTNSRIASKNNSVFSNRSIWMDATSIQQIPAVTSLPFWKMMFDFRTSVRPKRSPYPWRNLRRTADNVRSRHQIHVCRTSLTWSFSRPWKSYWPFSRRHLWDGSSIPTGSPRSSFLASDDASFKDYKYSLANFSLFITKY